MRIPPSDQPKQPRARRRRRISHRGRIALIAIVVLLLVLFLSARGIAGFWTDYLWFDALGFGGVFSGLLLSRLALAAIFTIIFTAMLAINLWVADRLAPRFRQPGPEEQFLERYQQMLRGRRVWIARLGVSLLFGLIAGIPVASQWKDWILFTHAQSFGTEDPLFGVDVGFYVFRLPFLSFLMDWLFASLVIVLIITAVAHYLNGGIRLQVQGQRVTPQVKAHLSVLLAGLAVLRAAGYWLARYELLSSRRGVVDGATYTAVKAELPAINLLFLISILAAVLLVVNIWQRGWRLPVIAVGLWGLVAVVAGTIYPAFVQRFVVQPAESTRERPYIQRNIAATRDAMNLADVQTIDYQLDALDPTELAANTDNLKNVRLLDPEVVPDTYKRLQAFRGYYDFNDLDVDRYTIDGDEQQVVLAARELNPQGLPSNTWENRHLAYTHGFGLALAPASQIQADGKPAFLTLDAESTPRLDTPELYYGERLLGYAVVNTERAEISYDPSTGNEVNTSYEGDAGVEMGSFLRRAAFALRFGEWNLMVSNLITAESKILYVRDVVDRVKLLAPFLNFDNDPYPVVIDGHVKWIIDAYTTSDRYPYAQIVDTGVLQQGSGLRVRFNYARNSVKAVVDAYDGTVAFYVIDQQDPVARAYRSAFPKLFSDLSSAPAGLTDHFRYPEDLFRAQTSVFSRYHIEDPSQFYQRANAWNVSQNPPNTQSNPQAVPETNAAGVVTGTREARMPPYYTMLQLPDQELQFVLLRPFVPFSDRDERKELQAIMTASSKWENYGQMQVLVMNESPLPEGPSIVDTDIKQQFAAELTLLDQRGSQVTFGNMQVLPIGNSLVYVRPWFVSATSTTPVPELRYVTVSHEKRSFRGNSLEDALAQAFPGTRLDLGTVIGGTGVAPPPTTPADGGETPTTTTTPSTAPSTSAPGQPTGSVEELLQEAQRLYDEAQAALRSGDLGTYQEKLDAAYRKAAEAASAATGETVSPGSSDSTTTTGQATTTTLSA